MLLVMGSRAGLENEKNETFSKVTVCLGFQRGSSDSVFFFFGIGARFLTWKEEV